MLNPQNCEQFVNRKNVEKDQGAFCDNSVTICFLFFDRPAEAHGMRLCEFNPDPEMASRFASNCPAGFLNGGFEYSIADGFFDHALG
jgi:hypothetical protein